MKQTILLMVLALGISIVNVSAQSKKPVRKTAQTKPEAQSTPKDSRDYQVENDGFEWYRVCKNGKYGAENRNGTTLVPCEYSFVTYLRRDPIEKDLGGFLVRKGKYVGWYNEDGKCIIPYTRSYIDISKRTGDNFGTYFLCKLDDATYNIHNLNGNIAQSFKLNPNTKYKYICPQWNNSKFYYQIQSEDLGWGIADGNGNTIIAPSTNFDFISIIGDELTTRRISDGKSITLGSSSLIATSINPLANNPKEGKNYSSPSNRFSSSSSSTESSGSSSNNNNSGNKTTTVVVEHHRDPIPVQEWRACWACGGMGTMGCDNCGGSGTVYIGDRLHRCSRCNTRGVIPCNICYGNKGQYITVYR